VSAHDLTVTVHLNDDTMRSGDDAAAALRSLATTLANTFDGLTLPEDGGAVIDPKSGSIVGEWVVS
jgi:hypothetical protein